MSNTIYRFTPPTCTLEIKGNRSLLSRWKKQDLLKKFQFQLSFDDPRMPTSKQVEIKGHHEDFDQLKTAVDKYIQNYLHSSFVFPSNSLASEPSPNEKINDKLNGRKFNSNDVFFEPEGLTNHQLFLANLSHDAATNKIKLSTVQLFDLVSALEAYGVEVAALPELSQIPAKKVMPLWGSLAAVTMAVIGIIIFALKIPQPQNVASDSKSNSSTKEIPQLNEVIPPQVPATTKKNSPNLEETEPLKSAKRLPSPPAVDTPKPKPNIPNPEDYSLAKVEEQSGLNYHSQNTPQQTQSEIAVSTAKSPEDNKNDQDNQGNTVIDPQDEAIKKPSSESVTSDRAGVAPIYSPKTSPENNQDLVGNSLPSSTTGPKETSVQPDQLQAIQTFFADRWQPPADLKQSLEYRLYLNSDGSVERVVPLGKAAQLYLSKTNIPVKGESFVSLRPQAQKSVIRLLLNPDGGVKTFIE